MKIYLAARYSRHREMVGYREKLRAWGHEVTSRWIDGNHQVDDSGLSRLSPPEQRIQFAQEDVEDLLAADCVISFTEEPRSTNSRGGRHVEFGLGLGRGKLLIVVGPRENVFHCLPEVEVFETWPEVARLLGVCPHARPHSNA